MSKLLRAMRNTALGLSLVIASAQSFASDASKEDMTIQEEMVKFSAENEKLREDHYQEMRAIEIKHINDYYDRKSAINKELGEMWKQIKPEDKKGSKELRKEIKKKQEAYREELKKFKKDFNKDVVEAKNKIFHDSMKERIKGMKQRHKN